MKKKYILLTLLILVFSTNFFAQDSSVRLVRAKIKLLKDKIGYFALADPDNASLLVMRKSQIVEKDVSIYSSFVFIDKKVMESPKFYEIWISSLNTSPALTDNRKLIILADDEKIFNNDGYNHGISNPEVFAYKISYDTYFKITTAKKLVIQFRGVELPITKIQQQQIFKNIYLLSKIR